MKTNEHFCQSVFTQSLADWLKFYGFRSCMGSRNLVNVGKMPFSIFHVPSERLRIHGVIALLCSARCINIDFYWTIRTT